MSAMNALAWSYAGTLTRIAGQFGLALIMARLLGPEPYGILAVAMLPVSLGALVADAGLGSALIQKREISRALITQCMWWQMLVGLGLALTVTVFALPLTSMLSSKAALPHMIAIALVLPLGAVTQVPTALLRRHMRFRELQIANVAAVVLGNAGVGLPLALAGAGAWALVAALWSQYLATLSIVWWYAHPPWSWRYQPWPTALFRFGSSVVGLNVTNWLITNTETIALAKAMSVTSLGAYNRVSLLSVGAGQMLLPPLQAVLFSQHSRNQDDLARIRADWWKTAAVTLVAFSIIAAPLLIAPGTVIAWTLGGSWTRYQDVLRVLSVAMVANSLMGICGPVVQALGHPGREFGVQVAVLLVAIPVLLWGAATQSLLAFSWAVAAVALLRCLGMTTTVVATLWAPADTMSRPFRAR